MCTNQTEETDISKAKNCTYFLVIKDCNPTPVHVFVPRFGSDGLDKVGSRFFRPETSSSVSLIFVTLLRFLDPASTGFGVSVVVIFNSNPDIPEDIAAIASDTPV